MDQDRVSPDAERVMIAAIAASTVCMLWRVRPRGVPPDAMPAPAAPAVYRPKDNGPENTPAQRAVFESMRKSARDWVATTLSRAEPGYFIPAVRCPLAH